MCFISIVNGFPGYRGPILTGGVTVVSVHKFRGPAGGSAGGSAGVQPGSVLLKFKSILPSFYLIDDISNPKKEHTIEVQNCKGTSSVCLSS